MCFEAGRRLCLTLLKSRMNVAFDLPELFPQEVLAQLVQETEKRTWSAAPLWLHAQWWTGHVGVLVSRGSCQGSPWGVENTVCHVPMASPMGWAGRDPGVTSNASSWDLNRCPYGMRMSLVVANSLWYNGGHEIFFFITKAYSNTIRWNVELTDIFYLIWLN